MGSNPFSSPSLQRLRHLEAQESLLRPSAVSSGLPFEPERDRTYGQCRAPRHFLLFLCLYLRIRLGRLNLVVGSNSVSATTSVLSIGALYPATIRFFILRVCYCTKARKHYSVLLFDVVVILLTWLDYGKQD